MSILVERISGQPFDQYVREHILNPLGMTQTRYVVPESDRGRFAALYERGDDGALTRVPGERAHAFNTIGIDFAVRVRPPASAEENTGVVGEFFWDGAASTLFWVDPAAAVDGGW